MTKSIYKFLFFFVSILCFLNSCNDTVNPPQPLPPEMSANFSGYDSLKFESQVLITKNNLGDRLQLGLSGYMDSKQIGMVISIFYLDSILKAGTFNIVSSSQGINYDYAMAALYIGKGDNQKTFYADSGTVIITQIKGLTINGSFKFFATELNGDSQLIVDNGVLAINW